MMFITVITCLIRKVVQFQDAVSCSVFRTLSESQWQIFFQKSDSHLKAQLSTGNKYCQFFTPAK